MPSEITAVRTPQLWHYLMRGLGIEEIKPDAFARHLGVSFMRRQTDEQKVLWRPRTRPGQEPGPLRNKRFIRLRDLSHVVPFRADGNTPKVLLSIEGETDLPNCEARGGCRRASAPIPTAAWITGERRAMLGR